MKKLYVLIIVFIFSLSLAWCSSTPVELPTNTDFTFGLGQTYFIWSEEVSQENVYWIVVWDNLKNIFSTIWWFLSSFDCQPGDHVSPDTLIASIKINDDDPMIKNLRIQQSSLQTQLQTLKSTYAMTEQNFVIQQQTLAAQIANTQETYDQDNADIKKLEDSIQNFKDQQQNGLDDVFKKVRTSGWNAKYLDLYDELYDQRDDVEDMDNEDFSRYLEDMADLMKKAAKYASGDTLSTLFMWLSNGFRSSKSTFDTLVASLASAKNGYATQHNTLGLTLDLADEQTQAIENNKHIQLNLLNSQMQTLQQNIDSIANSLKWETLYAWVDGIVKAKLIWNDNKVNPNTMICQIVPTDIANKKIQIYSANKIALWQVVELYNGDAIVWAAKIEYELPYRDTMTQNYIYEIIHLILKPGLVINEGDRLTVQFFKKQNPTEVWIPVNFVFAKLDGNYVRIKSWSWFVEKKVDLWAINGDLVRVTSGASLGQTIVN